MMVKIKAETTEFIARTITDLGKATLTVGVAGYFFQSFPASLKFIIGSLGVGFIFTGTLLFALRDGG